MKEWLQAIIDNPGTSLGIGIAIVALVVSTAAWWFPRRPRIKKLPEYRDEITNDNSHKFTKFLEKNDTKIVRLSTFVPYYEEGIVDESAEEDGRIYHTLSLKVQIPKEEIGQILELNIRPEKGSIHSPLVFANGAYHLRGFFIVEHHPGMWQGTTAASITEVSPEQLALRS